MSEKPVLYYYNGFLGRVEGPMLLLEDAGVEYTFSSDVDVPRAKEPSCFAPPFCKDGDVYMSQSLAICQHLGIKYGLAGSPEQQGIMMRTCCNIEDFWGESYRVCKNGKDRESAAAFATSERFGKWLGVLQGPLKAGGTFLFGASPTFSDYLLLATLRAVNSMYPKSLAAMLGTAELAPLKAWYEMMQARPNIVAFYASDRCKPALYDSVMDIA